MEKTNTGEPQNKEPQNKAPQNKEPQPLGTQSKEPRNMVLENKETQNKGPQNKMPQKQKANTNIQKAKVPKTVPNVEKFKRMNYLYQVSTFYEVSGNTQFSRMCMKNMSSITKKNVLKVRPKMSRTFCKRCDVRLLAGLNCSVRLSDEQLGKSCVLAMKCEACGHVKNYPVGQNLAYVSFNDNEENMVAADHAS